MKHFIDKMFRPSHKDSKTQSVFPSLPAHLTKRDAQQRALVGWIARRVGQLLTLEVEESDFLFYAAFSYQSKDDKKNEFDKILYFAERLVRYGATHKSVLEKAPDIMVTPTLENCLTKVEEEYRGDLSRDREYQISGRDDRGHPPFAAQTKEDDWNKRVWQVYRDVIFAATQKKFLLITNQEVDSYRRGNVHLEVEIKERADITKCREDANHVFLKLGCAPSSIMGRLLVISEAVTNILKHAEHGKMMLVDDDHSTRAVIQDKGPGFSITDLPNTTLLAGYSTKKSLGQGFTLMMKMSDQVLLATSPEGSTIILVFNKKQDKE
ncbi:ATP-binding protein [Alicyclobacillus fastidiosus]|uniref:ATP-binding protein n=1 Tax=Alicyclobacillus fastidiosus TaxID=392011 RepID=A0ABV5AJQ6_9BACL|nr:ATP-binding protein [Alicyclobacillus fastidiosus]WEH10101.1 ATP-binding protein [Alicyclobacillus fastidiosus]